jgi:hypothetical protein
MNAITKEEQTALTLPERAAVALGTAAHEIKLRELLQTSINIVSVTNVDGRAECHAAYMTLKNSRITVEKAGKAATEDAKAFSKAVSAEEKRLIAIIAAEEDRLQTMRDKWDEDRAAERQALIAAERARVDAIHADIAAIRNMVATAAGKPSMLIKAACEIVTEICVDETRFGEFLPEAKQALVETFAKLESMFGDARTAEEAAAKLEEERLAEAARMAAERIQIERDRAELTERAAEQNRIYAAQEAEALAQFQAERARQAVELAAERAKADGIRALEDDARAFRINQERDALLAQANELRVERERLQAIANKQIAEQPVVEPVQAPIVAPTKPSVISDADVVILALQDAYAFITGQHDERDSVIAHIERALDQVDEPYQSELAC